MEYPCPIQAWTGGSFLPPGQIYSGCPAQARKKVEQLQRGFDYISGDGRPNSPSLNGQVQAIEELKWGAEISEICLSEGIRILQGDKRNDSIDGEGLINSFEENWLRRARPGGLRKPAHY